MAGSAVGCTPIALPSPTGAAAPSQSTSDAEESIYFADLVLAVFVVDSEFGSDDLLDTMWPIEQRADAALSDARAGYIDGNEIGGSEYALYFDGG